MRARRTEALLVFTLSVALAILLTYPLAFKLGHVGRVNTDDGRWSIWVVAWVARTLVADPAHLFDANIFYPHRDTLAFSESNLGAGAIALPVYWATRNPYAAHNFVVLVAFSLSAIGMYYLARFLTGSRGAAAVAAILYAFCPFVFARTAHIQLLMISGLPFSMLAFHRLIERRTLGRAVALSLVLVAQALSCGYYGTFTALMVGGGVLFYALSRGLWRQPRYWLTVGASGALALLLVLPFFLPYLRLQRETGFTRPLEDILRYSADWRAYLASSAWAHRWMLPLIERWNDVLFPGFLATALGVWAIATLVARRSTSRSEAALPGRDTVVFYAAIALLAFWASFGPAAGLYSVLYASVPILSFLRAPARFGLMVTFALAVLAACALASLLRRQGWPPSLPAAVAVLAVLELVAVPIGWREVPPAPAPYHALARMPRAPVAEFPFFARRMDFPRHALYMLNSTAHWYPLVNGYSDLIPGDFRAMVDVVSPFPTRESFQVLERLGVRYAIFHLNLYDRASRAALSERLERHRDYLRLIALKDQVCLYEIVAWPR